MDLFPAPLPSEVLYKELEDHRVPGRPLRWRPEQNSVSLMEDLVFTYSKTGALVMDTFPGTISTSEAFLSL